MNKQCVVMRMGQFWTGDTWSDEYPEAEMMGRREAKNAARILDAKAVEGYGCSDLVLVDYQVTS